MTQLNTTVRSSIVVLGLRSNISQVHFDIFSAKSCFSRLHPPKTSYGGPLARHSQGAPFAEHWPCLVSRWGFVILSEISKLGGSTAVLVTEERLRGPVGGGGGRNEEKCKQAERKELENNVR